MFGTLRTVASTSRPVVFGLPRSLRNHDTTVVSALVDPLRAAARVLFAASARDRPDPSPELDE